MEEFQEADVLWSDDNLDGGGGGGDDDDDDMVSKKQPSTQQRAPWKESAKVDIPKASRSWAPSCTCHDYDINSEDGDGEDDLGNNNRDHERIPPHIIVARRTADKMAFSVCTGLKGRHLRHVRNSILRMTGFLER